MHMARPCREEHRGLPCRVSSADNHDWLTNAGTDIDWSRRIVNAGSFEAFQPRDVEPSVIRAGCDHDRSRRNCLIVVKVYQKRLF
jgi:hypothetical protein